MKKICSVLAVLVLFGTAVWAQDAAAKTDQTLLDAKVGNMNVTLYGDANARFGMQSMTADNTSLWSAMLMSGLSGNSGAFLADMMAAQTAFATKFITQIGGGLISLDDAITAGGKEAALFKKAGFTQANATALATAFAGGTGAAAYATLYGSSYSFGIANTDATLAGNLDKDYTKSGMYYGLKNENAVKLGTKLASADGKFTGDVSAKYTSGAYSNNPVDIQTAWFKYDLGPVAIKYNSHDGNQHWDSDILYVGDNSLQNALDFEIKPVEGIGYAFFTLMSNEAVTSGVKYFNTEFRTVPMMQIGYVYTAALGDMGSVEATAGAAIDQYAKKDADYNGYIAFGGAKWAKGQMASETGSLVVGLNGLFGKNTAGLAGMNSGDMEQATLGLSNLAAVFSGATSDFVYNSVRASGDKDSTVVGGRLYGGYTLWTGGIVSVDARLSSAKLYGSSDAYTAIRLTGGLTQFLGANFSATLGGGYEKYSVDAGDKNYDPAHGYEITLDLGYRF